MKSILLAGFLFGSIVSVQAQGNIPSSEVQIKTAVLAAPEEFRSGAKVLGYNEKGEWVVLRKGENEMVCQADDPNNAGFSVSCYHQDLEAFMERGRALKAEGKGYQEVFDTREAEVKSGKLKMPEHGTTLFIYSTKQEEDYNPTTGDVSNGNFRYVVYIPYATAESTGLPLSPEAPGMPWIMDPGTHRAHIMINP